MMKKKNLLIFAATYLVFYCISFFLLETRNADLHLINTWLDEVIPFCEYFIIPYFYWFIFLAATGIYFIFFCKNYEESKRFLYAICTGTTIFLIVSFIYPNGHTLRPELTGDGFFIMAVRLLYQIDTPTNILPSMHVYATVACSAALLRQPSVKKKKWLSGGIWISSILIILSTMFLKQHSVVDVLSALLLNIICYQIFYKWNIRPIGKIVREENMDFIM